MIDATKVQSIIQGIGKYAQEGLTQKEARNKMILQYHFLDNIRLRIWIAVGYYMYEKEKKERRTIK